MPTDTSKPFTEMAARIDHNVESTFGGAVVIVPPAQGGNKIELLMLDAKGDPAQFWGTLLTRIQQEIAEIDNRRAVQQGFGVVR